MVKGIPTFPCLAGFTFDKMLHTTPDDVFDIIQRIHVRAPFRLIREAAPYFRLKGDKRENRAIINISSTSGLHGNVGQVNYAAAKSAVLGLTKTVAKEWGPYGVRANTVAFGLIKTRCAPFFYICLVIYYFTPIQTIHRRCKG
jgi:3-oxoacyl-[acyl-carrier protein] reductase